MTCDDKGDPNGGIQCGQDAVSDKVVAVVSSLSLVGTGITALEKAKIPYIAPSSTSALDGVSPMPPFPCSRVGLPFRMASRRRVWSIPAASRSAR